MRPGFSFLICPDSLLLREELERQISGCLSADGKWRRLVFWGDEDPDASFWEALTQVGLFADNRILVIRQADLWSTGVWSQLSSVLSRELDHVWPFFCLESAWEKGKAKVPACIQKSRCFAFAEKKRWIWRSGGLGQNLQKFTHDHAKSLGLVFEPDAFASFCSASGSDALAVLNELKKLSLTTESGKITTSMLAGNYINQEGNAFGLIKKLMNADLSGAWQEVTSDTDGSLLFFVLALLAREFRTLWQIENGEEPWLHPGEASRKRSLARKLGYTGISKGLNELANAEWQVKSGRQSPAQALESLSLAMHSLFGGWKISSSEI